MVNDPETSVAREGRRRGILARSFIRLHASSPPFFFSPASLLREGSNDPFKKIADLREGTLSFFFPLNCVRISENLLAKFLLEWKQGLEFYSKVVQKVCGVLI